MYLFTFQVDVLVNTVNLSLDLKKGRLSKQILKEAGDELQDFCTKNYPDGIEAGNIAVTQPGKLQKNGVKWIFHCALPPFKKSTFVKVTQESFIILESVFRIINNNKTYKCLVKAIALVLQIELNENVYCTFHYILNYYVALRILFILGCQSI